jgi:hypothetical protein
MKNTTMALAAFRIGLALTALTTMHACGKTGGGTDSNTNFLGPCDRDADCGSALACVCGMCTTPCDQSAECGAVAEGAECAPSADVFNASDCGSSLPASVCTLGCQRDETCRALSVDLRCVAGICSAGASPVGDGGDEPDGAAERPDSASADAAKSDATIESGAPEPTCRKLGEDCGSELRYTCCGACSPGSRCVEIPTSPSWSNDGCDSLDAGAAVPGATRLAGGLPWVPYAFIPDGEHAFVSDAVARSVVRFSSECSAPVSIGSFEKGERVYLLGSDLFVSATDGVHRLPKTGGARVQVTPTPLAQLVADATHV